VSAVSCFDFGVTASMEASCLNRRRLALIIADRGASAK
jgi:hypothetical protein